METTSGSPSSHAQPPIPAAQPGTSLPALLGLFGAFYFLQGIGEPDDGLITQPVRSLLTRWGQSVGQQARFSALLTLPWTIKPLYGLISDFVPLAGYRRKSYLMLWTGLSAAALFVLASLSLTPDDATLVLVLLMVPAVGTAFCDVAIDGLMIQHGQARGWTGQLQSMQWTGMYAAAVLTGVLGGYLSQHRIEQFGFYFCGCACLAALVLSYFAPEQRQPSDAARRRPQARLLVDAWRIPTLRAAAVFLFLWNFNPFTSTILQSHLVKHIGFSDQFFGNLKTITALGSVGGALSYGLLRRHVRFRWLLQGAVVLGIVSTASYWGLREELPAKVVSAVVGYTAAVATLIQLDLAAQVCPVEIAGTVFAVLMSLINLSTALAEALGGQLYDRLSVALGGRDAAFHALLVIGSLTTAGCWLVMPWLLRDLGTNADRIEQGES